LAQLQMTSLERLKFKAPFLAVRKNSHPLNLKM